MPDFDTTAYSFDYASLFRNNRFSGYDRIGDTKQLSLGLTSRLIDEKGREAVSASVGQAIYFEDRVVSLDNTTPTDNTSNYSDVATRVNWRPNQRMNVTFNANFNHEDIRNTENNLAVRYQEDVNRLISLSYRFSEDIREQSTASFLWPVSKNWSTLGVWQYDWMTSDNIDLAFGLEYESCCWKTRVITRQWLKDNDEKDTALYLQFVLKGLGSFGSSGDSDFIEKITGFEQREETNDQF
jgi:LPS-assembly protein